MNISNDLSLLIDTVRYEVQYVDYEPNQYTAPVILTRERANRIVSDASVRKVRFTPIISSVEGNSFEFEGKYLTMS